MLDFISWEYWPVVACFRFVGISYVFCRDKKTQKQLLTDFRSKLGKLDERANGILKKNLYHLAWWELDVVPGDGKCDCNLCSMALFCP